MRARKSGPVLDDEFQPLFRGLEVPELFVHERQLILLGQLLGENSGFRRFTCADTVPVPARRLQSSSSASDPTTLNAREPQRISFLTGLSGCVLPGSNGTGCVFPVCSDMGVIIPLAHRLNSSRTSRHTSGSAADPPAKSPIMIFGKLDKGTKASIPHADHSGGQRPGDSAQPCAFQPQQAGEAPVQDGEQARACVVNVSAAESGIAASPNTGESTTDSTTKAVAWMTAATSGVRVFWFA